MTTLLTEINSLVPASGCPQNIIINAATTTNGRYANQFIRAMAAHFISQNLGAKPLYPPINLAKLGIHLYQPSLPDNIETDKKTAPNIINLEETNFIDFASQPPEQLMPSIPQNTLFDLNHIYCQTPEHALKINDFLRDPANQNRIKLANPHKERYGENNDVFIHVRLGDVPFHNPGFAYYDRVLADLEFQTGYITSDTITHPICRALINKYRLRIIHPHTQIEDILQFGSTCKHIILSAGTFSWLIGMLGFQSQIYYPDPALKKRWHGDIFECMPGWAKMGY
jgi:hypothetical protein